MVRLIRVGQGLNAIWQVDAPQILGREDLSGVSARWRKLDEGHRRIAETSSAEKGPLCKRACLHGLEQCPSDPVLKNANMVEGAVASMGPSRAIRLPHWTNAI